MTHTCFNCNLWKCDEYKLSTGKCHLDPAHPMVKKANEGCLLWRAGEKIEFE